MRFSTLAAIAATSLLALAIKPAAAQSRFTTEWTVLPELQAEFALRGNDYLLVGFNLARPVGVNKAYDVDPGFQFRLGYERFWNPNWSWGATFRIGRNAYGGNGDFLNMPGSIVPGLLLRHSSQIGPLRFSQRLAAEYATSFVILGDSPRNRALARLRLGLDHEFGLGSTLKLRPRLSYEVLTYLRFQRDEDQPKEQFVDLGGLRGELGVRLSPRFDLTPWVASQTSYMKALDQFDVNGNRVSGGNFRFVSPVVGLDLRVTLGRAALDADRQPLPTQH
ncbi:hypothetical protein D0N36_18040 [Hymenobacter lapidiphilus]|uniref:hypothetical protein n=1 Tax=Hymenobacter sp. CCM 8763 TaxID=2303334 RepID=UPI000E351299|nr:hypothetical protein [Hymenobacter sp. CCM 8763]RFP63706.1 hypothetical protein D0N36_18040 [Hymenobacter sp. CCM 8763]